jgi:hypothetical protein
MMRRIGAGGAVFVLYACASSYGDAPRTTLPVEAGAPDAAAPADAPVGCSVIYVSPAGSDANTGCVQSAPKATIGAAVGYVKTAALTGIEIHVCKGDYPEHTLTIDYPVTLRGGFECALWKRSDPFGWQGFDTMSARAIDFGATNESIIDAGDAVAALDINGAAVTSAVEIEGFTIKGRATGGGQAVTIRDHAAPKLVNDTVTGPAAGIVQGNDAGSVGIEISTAAAPEITHCRVNGGSGGDLMAPIGSIGIFLHDGASAHIHENDIDSGLGRAHSVGAMAIGARVQSGVSGANAIENNTIVFEGIGDQTVAIGISTTSATDVKANIILGGQLTCTGTTTCSGFGLATGPGADQSNFLGNRIYTGISHIGAVGTTVTMYGVFVQRTNDVQVASNEILIGPSTVLGYAVVTDTTSARTKIVRNTVVGGASTTLVGFVSQRSDQVITGNLVAAAAFGLSLTGCANASASLSTGVTNNAFVAVDNVASVQTDPGCTSAQLKDVATFESKVPGATGNQETVCTNATSCLQPIFGRYPTYPDFVATGLVPAPTIPCALAHVGAHDTTVCVP